MSDAGRPAGPLCEAAPIPAADPRWRRPDPGAHLWSRACCCSIGVAGGRIALRGIAAGHDLQTLPLDRLAHHLSELAPRAHPLSSASPVRAYRLSRLFAALTTPPGGWRSLCPFCVLGIAAHVTGDIFTVFGTWVLCPLSDAWTSLRGVFDIDSHLPIMKVFGSVITLATDRRARPSQHSPCLGATCCWGGPRSMVAEGTALRSPPPSSPAGTDAMSGSPRAVPDLSLRFAGPWRCPCRSTEASRTSTYSRPR